MKRRNCEIKYIENKSRRKIAFSKRKRGIFRKARMLEILTNSRIMIFIANDTNKMFSYCSDELKNLAEYNKEMIAGVMLNYK